MIFYYSGCGNSAFVAETLSELLGEGMRFIPDMMGHDKVPDYTFGDDEALGLVFPVYSWAPPAIVTHFVESLHMEGKPSFVYMVCTAGDDIGCTAEMMAQTLRKRDLELSSAYSVIMPETYINLPGFQLDSPEGEQRKIGEARALLPQIAEAIRNRRREERLHKGAMAWLKSHPVRFLFEKCLITDRPFCVLDSCVSCGICTECCPVHNIQLRNGRPEWQHHCIGCMACYHHCPQNAIHFGKQTIGKGQYYFGH